MAWEPPTANFGLETAPESVTLSFNKCQPTGTGSTNGGFGSSVGSFAGGAASATNLNWSDVGNGDLVATLKSGSYLGSGLTATGNTGTGGTVCTSTGGAGNVGPFIPDHYTTVVTPACGNVYTYSGQPFAVQVNAMNGLASPTITQNYDGTANTSPNFANTVTLSDTTGAALGTLTLTSVPVSAFTAGVGSVTQNYTFTSRTTNPTSSTMHATYTNSAPAYTVTSSGFPEGSTTIDSGRARFSNAEGSEVLALPVPFSTEYWFYGWVTNVADSCTGDTSLGAGNAVSVALSSPPATCVQDNGSPGLSGAGCAAAGPAAQRFTKGATPGIGFSGNFNLWLKAPGAGNTGAVTVTGNVPVWLQYPWRGGAAINPTALATFGVYKGPKAFIYQREDY